MKISFYLPEETFDCLYKKFKSLDHTLPFRVDEVEFKSYIYSLSRNEDSQYITVTLDVPNLESIPTLKLVVRKETMMNEEILRKAGFGGAVDRIKQGLCPMCGKPIGTFKDPLSEKEYQISGMCQECQDSVFKILYEE